MEDFNTFKQQNCVCPYCGYINQDSWELQHDSSETWCHSCDAEFHYERDITITYSTNKLKKNKS